MCSAERAAEGPVSLITGRQCLIRALALWLAIQLMSAIYQRFAGPGGRPAATDEVNLIGGPFPSENNSNPGSHDMFTLPSSTRLNVLDGDAPAARPLSSLLRQR